MVENHKPALAVAILNDIKEYWFLITLVISIATSGLYMLVFQIDPFEAYREMSQRKQAIASHLELGQRLLDFGHYKKASSEFAHSLELSPSNLLAMEGKRKADLFVQMEDVNWDPGEAMAYLASFPDQDEEDYNVLLFMGKLNETISEPEEARSYYERARNSYRKLHDSEYHDALLHLGWLSYAQHDVYGMEKSFRAMTDIAKYDHRGYHGLGYGLYLQAYDLAKRKDPKAWDKLSLATETLHQASRYARRVCTVLADTGEVARVIDHNFSIYYHELALRCVAGEDDFNIEANKGTFWASLLSTKDESTNRGVFLEHQEDKLAWVRYLLALDYLVKALKGQPDWKALTRHGQLIEEAKAIQRSDGPQELYEDQKATIEHLLATTGFAHELPVP